MTQNSYGQFCPVAMAAEIVCNRWTVIVLRELVAGSTRFNEIRRGVPRMSPALLSKRLKELEEAGVVARIASPTEPGVLEYHLTRAGRELQPVVEALGFWGQRWVDSNASLNKLDPDLLMWDMRRNIDLVPMPQRRSVIAFIFPEQSAKRRNFWLVVAPGSDVDLCSIDPGFDVDLYVSTDLRTMTAIWMGLTTLRAEVASGKVLLTGDRKLGTDMETWLRLSPFAVQSKAAIA
jgi:DNA-binding HxlR family transcriptional regulator